VSFVKHLTPLAVIIASLKRQYSLKNFEIMSGYSSLRNAVKRVAHKERSQPLERKKFGLLGTIFILQ
jgi:hypothetical protein